MLTIKIEDNYKEAIAEMGLEVAEDAVVMEVRDADLLMGVGVMRLFDTYAEITDICLKDEFKEFTLEYGVGKSLLNVVDLRGIRFAVSNNENIEKQLRALKFKAPSEQEKPEDFPDEVSSAKLCLCLDGYFLAKC